MTDDDTTDTPEHVASLPGVIIWNRFHVPRDRAIGIATTLHKIVSGLAKDEGLPAWVAVWLARANDAHVLVLRGNGHPVSMTQAVPFDPHCRIEVEGFCFFVTFPRRGPLTDPSLLLSEHLCARMDPVLTEAVRTRAPDKIPRDAEFSRIVSETIDRVMAGPSATPARAREPNATKRRKRA